MTPRTRNANKETDFKVYYSKKPPPKPQQRYFPSRRKVVRQKPGHTAQDMNMNGRRGGKRQLRFLPEMMRRGTVQDSEDEDEEDLENVEEGKDVEEVEKSGKGLQVKEEASTQLLQSTPARRRQERNSEVMAQDEEEEKPVQMARKAALTKGKKRDSDVLQPKEEEVEEPVQSTMKRRRTSAKNTPRKSAPRDDAEDSAQGYRPRLRRQSTMTQLVDGRKPTPGSREPDFRPVRRNSGKGKGSRKESAKDRKQRTLTQMVPGLGSFGVVTDDEEEDGETDADEVSRYHDEMAKHLEGVFEPNRGREKRPGAIPPTPHYRGLSVDAEEGSTRHLPEKPESYEEDTDDEAAADYQPTQDVQAQIMNTRRTSKRLSSTLAPASAGAKSTTRRPGKTNFSLLSTPERRKVKFIPSSQSPPSSSLSTQSTSPIKSARRPPLGVRSGNSDRLLDTPSKLRKVTFQEPGEPNLAPPTLRKFESTIPDSEDEGVDWSEDEIESTVGKRTGAETQALIRGTERKGPAVDVGADTQAVLQQIDLACANADDHVNLPNMEPLEDVRVPSSGGPREVSQELGEEPAEYVDDEVHATEQEADSLEDAIIEKETDIKEEGSLGAEAPRSSPPIVKSEPTREKDVSAISSQPKPSTQEPIHGEDVSMFPTQAVSALQEPAHEEDIVTESAPPELPFSATQYFEKESQPINEEVEASLPVQNTITVDWNEFREDLPSTPMVINDSDEEEESSPTPQRLLSKVSAVTPSSLHHSMTDLDGEPIQVPRSPNTVGESQRSYTSHSSKAEKQIQNEWLSHTQYFRNRVPQSSSMHGIQDELSYQATPLPNRSEMAPPQSTAAALFSQATTVDYTQSSPHTTPKKTLSRSQFHASPRKMPSKAQSHYQKSPHTTPKKTSHKIIPHSQPLLSAHTTPHKPTSSLQDFVSPVRPPPLIIPSSFPSPGRAGMQWSSPLARSSPILGMETQSVDDFSMPPLPPLVIESSDVEDEEL